MAQERKRIEKKPTNVVTPKKRDEPKKQVATKTKVEPKEANPIVEEPKELKQSIKFIKICEGSKQEEYRAIGERVQRGEIKFSHYAIDGNKGCRYYYLIKKV
jgi:hypothetical protein